VLVGDAGFTPAGFTLGEHRIPDLRRRRLGVIVPASNTNAEPDCLLLAPAGLTLHVTRSGGYDVEAIPDSAEMRRFARQALDQQLQLLVDARVELIAYACTSATLSDGPEFDAAFCAEITAKSGLPAVTTAGALVEATRDLGATRVAFTSPYVAKLAQESVEFLQKCGIDVVNQLGFERELSSLEQNRLSPQDAYRMGLAADHPQAELLVISCTDYRALEAVPALEQALGKPVVTSNSALMYVCLKRLGIEMRDVEAGGYLFTRRN
jgi:maleate cis-trans isomerase